MKIIFLDIDGVLNCKATCAQSSKNYKFDADKVVFLNDIIHQTQANIVVSSSWRCGMTIKNLQDMFGKNGVNGIVIGSTPSSTHGRGDEIQQWIKNHYGVESFIIIDDDDFDMGDLLNRVVLTDMETGLQAKHVEQAITLFGMGK